MDEHDMLAVKAQVDAETAANKAEHDSFKRRLTELETSSKRQNDILLALQRQGDAIENIGKKLESMTASISSTVKRLEAIEKEPADEYKKLRYEIIKYIVIAVVGAFAGYFIKGM